MQTQTKSKVLFLVTALYMKKLIFELGVNSATFLGWIQPTVTDRAYIDKCQVASKLTLENVQRGRHYFKEKDIFTGQFVIR